MFTRDARIFFDMDVPFVIPMILSGDLQLYCSTVPSDGALLVELALQVLTPVHVVAKIVLVGNNKNMLCKALDLGYSIGFILTTAILDMEDAQISPGQVYNIYFNIDATLASKHSCVTGQLKIFVQPNSKHSVQPIASCHVSSYRIPIF